MQVLHITFALRLEIQSVFTAGCAKGKTNKCSLSVLTRQSLCTEFASYVARRYKFLHKGEACR